MLGIAAIVFLLVTAAADISLAPAPEPETGSAVTAGASATAPDIEVVVHEGGIATIEEWATDAAREARSTLEDARLRTKDVLSGLGDLVGL